MNLVELLEHFKKEGNYGIRVYYGEGIGCDDMDMPQDERMVQIVMAPVGYLGGVRKLLVIRMGKLHEFDVSSKPEKVYNPPPCHVISQPGYYAWGTGDSINEYMRKL